MPNLFHSFVSFIKSELRLAVSLGILLLILVGLSLAGGNSCQFDFGDGSALESNYLAVDGGASMYPISASGLEYGWVDEAMVFSSGAAVSNKLNRDGNNGVDPASFRITGLDNGNYRLSLVSGSLNSAFSTKVTVNAKSFSTITQVNQWNTLTFDVVVNAGQLDLLFQRAGTNPWGVNSLVVAPSPTPVVSPTFDVTVQPILHTVRVGGTAIYRVSVNPLNGYASEVDLSLSGLVGNVTAKFAPASAIPPLVADLILTTSATTPLTQYDFVVTAKGRDASVYTVNKSISLVVTGSTAVPTVVNPDTSASTDSTKIDGNGQTGSGSGSLDNIYLAPRTSAEARNEQNLIDEYAAVEAKRLASTREILEIKDISTINGFEPLPDIAARTPFESTLQYMTAAGIIGTTVDSAPPAPVSDPKPIGFWERLFKTMVNPTL
ncbi:hypothetical protein JXA59_00720 [Patescibacteria group bacterium]|nr:hypothetical protein [Patescibacteria group bacterium]